MTTSLTSRTLSVTPLIVMHNPAFACAYRQGMQWLRFEQQEHHGPLLDSNVTETLTNLARTGIFDEEHEATLCESLGSYFGMIHGAVLSKQGTIEQGATTLVHLQHQDVRNGYHAGREFFFLESECEEERMLSDRDIIAWLKEVLHDAAKSQDPQGVFHYCVGCLLGRLSGQLFTWTRAEHQRWEQHCIKELGYVCALLDTCLVALMGLPTVHRVSSY